MAQFRTTSERTAAHRKGMVAVAGTLIGAVAAALVLPMDLAWPLALVAPFVGMTILDACLECGSDAAPPTQPHQAV